MPYIAHANQRGNTMRCGEFVIYSRSILIRYLFKIDFASGGRKEFSIMPKMRLDSYL